MVTLAKNKFRAHYLPLLLSLVLVIAAVWFVSTRKQGSPPLVPGGVINPNAPIIKQPDQVSRIQVSSTTKAKEMVQIRFSWEQDGYKYNDALLLTPDEYARLTPTQIQERENQRMENWVNTVNSQSASN
jgi:hypothetical protein